MMETKPHTTFPDALAAPAEKKVHLRLFGDTTHGGCVFALALMVGCSGAQNDESIGDVPVEPTASPSLPENTDLNDFPISPFQGQVVINEVSSEDADEIEFLNLRSEPVDISGWFYVDDGWVLGDARMDDHRYVFPTGTRLDAATYLVMRKDEAHPFGLSGNGDSIWLLDAERRVVDGVKWGPNQASPSFCRMPNGMGDFETCAVKTLGARNEVPTPMDSNDAGVADAGSVDGGGADVDGDGGETWASDGGTILQTIVVNEISSSGDDVIELKNIGNENVDLTGWYVTDDSYDPEDSATFDKRHDFPTGTVLAAGAYLTLYKNTDHSFGLGTDDAVFLYDRNGDLIDECDWATDEAAVSYCRIPDGTGAFQACSTTSFNAINIE